MEAIQSWVSDNKLTSVGALWATAIGGSLAYNTGARSPLMKPSLRLIHARMHAQALTLAVLSSAAAFHYYDPQGSVCTTGRNHQDKLRRLHRYHHRRCSSSGNIARGNNGGWICNTSFSTAT